MLPPVEIKVSAACARREFNGCEPEYIKNVCHAACCRNTRVPEGCMVSIHPTEEAAIVARGGVVKAGLLKPAPGTCGCTFQNRSTHLCDLHHTPDKPFGCRASPFTLNANHTLVVRYRYTKLRCFRDGRRLPAYVAFRESLDLILGAEQAQRVCDHFAAGGGDIVCQIKPAIAQMLLDNDDAKRAYKEKWNHETPMDATAEQGDPEGSIKIEPIEIIPVGQLKVFEGNPRHHSEMNVAKIAQSIRTYGWTTPVLIDADNEVIAGHGRLLAAHTLGITEVPCIRLAHLTPELIKAYRIADNRLALDSEWDDELLSAALKELSEAPGFDLAVTGFNPDELASILGVTSPPAATRPLNDEETEALDHAWLQTCREWAAWVALVQANGLPVSPEITRGVTAIRFLRSLYFGDDFPSSATLSFTPHRFFTNGDKYPLPEVFGDALKSRSIRDSIQWVCRDEPKFYQFVSGTIPLHAHRMPGEFPARLAQQLIDEFCPEGGTVLDPCHGWGGRIVGWLLSKASQYWGWDPSEPTSKGVADLAAFLQSLTPWRQKEFSLFCSCFEDAEPPAGEFDFALTSPPYYDVEKYDGAESSWRRYHSLESWVEGFYSPMIAKVEAALKPGSAFALQVGSQAYPLVELARKLAGDHGFGFVGMRHTDMINNRTGTDPDEGEVVLIFRKAK